MAAYCLWRRHIRTKIYISARRGTGFLSIADSVEGQREAPASYRGMLWGYVPIEYWCHKHLPAPRAPTVLLMTRLGLTNQPSSAHLGLLPTPRLDNI